MKTRGKLAVQHQIKSPGNCVRSLQIRLTRRSSVRRIIYQGPFFQESWPTKIKRISLHIFANGGTGLEGKNLKLPNVVIEHGFIAWWQILNLRLDAKIVEKPIGGVSIFTTSKDTSNFLISGSLQTATVLGLGQKRFWTRLRSVMCCVPTAIARNITHYLPPASRTDLRRAHNPENRVQLSGWLPDNPGAYDPKNIPATLTRGGALNRTTDAVPVTSSRRVLPRHCAPQGALARPVPHGIGRAPFDRAPVRLTAEG